MIDASVSSSGQSRYQQNLAAIVALTQPVDKNCNPFAVSRYYRSFAWYTVQSLTNIYCYTHLNY